jgi:hypothetical protein
MLRRNTMNFQTGDRVRIGFDEGTVTQVEKTKTRDSIIVKLDSGAWYYRPTKEKVQPI